MNKVVIILALLMLSVQAKSDLDESYTYDANKNLTAESSTGTVMTGYGFDASFDDIDRVTQWDRDNATESQTWTLDKIGNWDNTTGSLAGNSFNETRTHNGVHELTAMGSNSVTYDDKGNMTTDANANTLVWDIDNHLESFGSIDFTYDALGRRLEKIDGTNSTLFICDGQRVIEEYEDSGSGYALARSYVHGSYVDDVVAKVEAVSTPTVLYYHSDRQFNVRGLSNSTGNIIELYAYSVYGQQTAMTSTGGILAGSSNNNSYGFTGRYLDDETGLWYFRARYFNDEMGRFINRDPLGYVDGMSLYGGYFAEMFAMDPSGRIIVTQVDSFLSKDGAGVNDTHWVSWDFTLENIYNKKGYIVQEVDMQIYTVDCETHEEKVITVSYFEHWIVDAEEILPVSRKGGYGFDPLKHVDKANFPMSLVKGTYGWMSQYGEIRFLPLSDELHKWKQGGVPYASALPSSWDQPEDWNSPLVPEGPFSMPERVGSRSLNIEWNLCECEEKYVNSRAEPE